jgi:hypothetical protein
MLVKYFSNAPFPLVLHVHIQSCFNHVTTIKGIFFTISMLSNLITQSPKIYELVRIMEYETKKPKSSHENVDYFPMFILST